MGIVYSNLNCLVTYKGIEVWFGSVHVICSFHHSCQNFYVFHPISRHTICTSVKIGNPITISAVLVVFFIIYSNKLHFTCPTLHMHFQNWPDIDKLDKVFQRCIYKFYFKLLSLKCLVTLFGDICNFVKFVKGIGFFIWV